MALTKVSRGLLSTSIVDNGNATAITIDSSNNVVIGSVASGTSSATPVELNLGSTFANTAGSLSKAKFKLFEDSSANVYGLSVSSGLMEFGVPSSAGYAFFINESEKMRMDSSGNLLVGKTSADYSDSSRGNVEIAGSSGALVGLSAGNTDSYIFQSGVNMDIFNVGAGYLRFATSNTERMRIDPAGRVGIGTSSPGATYHLLSDSAAASIHATTNQGTGYHEYRYASTTIAGYIGNGSGLLTGAAASDFILRSEAALVFNTNGNNRRMTIDSSGNLLVGTTNNSNSHIAVFDGSIGVVNDGNSTRCFQAFLVSNENWNVSNTAVRVGRDGTTGRSINAGGTVNASGADYAEYMTKSGDFNIAKGDICGVNSEGELTNVYDDAITFVVKSTDPSYVGGDVWGDGLNENELEQARERVDRISFSGQVPVNVLNANSGDYIVPTQDGEGISGVPVSNPTFEQYMMAVGKVIAIEDDGRARIIVKVS